jgi:hypothetical protein
MSQLKSELDRLSLEQATGRLGLGHEGAFHLIDGAVTHAESVLVPDLGQLLTRSGRITEAAWRQIQAHGLPLPAGSPLSQAELETVALLGLFDAAWLLLASETEPDFTKTEPHWLGAANTVTPATLLHEIENRRDRLHSVWPSPLADDAPVVPIKRIRRQRLILSGIQAELLVNADDRLTPAELARELGRTRYGCTLAVRGLVASELIEAPQNPPGVPAPRRTVGGAPRTVRNQDETRWAEVDLGLLHRLHDALEELE